MFSNSTITGPSDIPAADTLKYSIFLQDSRAALRESPVGSNRSRRDSEADPRVQPPSGSDEQGDNQVGGRIGAPGPASRCLIYRADRLTSQAYAYYSKHNQTLKEEEP